MFHHDEGRSAKRGAASLDELVRDIEARLHKVRRQNKRLGQALVAVLVIAAACLTMGATVQPPETVQARRLVLVDGNGKVRAVLGPSFDGGACLSLHDGAEHPRLVLGVRPDVLDQRGEGYLCIRDDKGVPKAELETVTGIPRLTFYSVFNARQAGLWLMPDGAPWLFLNRVDGSPSMDLSLWDGSSPRFTLWDSPSLPDHEAHVRAALGIWRDGSCRFYLTDAKAKPRAALRVSSDGVASLDLFDSKGTLVGSEP
jgi:hypothetical protein